MVSSIHKKIKTAKQLAALLASFRKKKKRIVFTNGCFDILHAGHTRYLIQAKKQGDILVVALNSDDSVKRIKGARRPIVPFIERAEVIAALNAVDYVTSFNEETPYQLISLLKPNILVKGGDWKKDQIIGADIVLKNGGKVKSIRYHKGKSTTHLIKRVLENYGDE